MKIVHCKSFGPPESLAIEEVASPIPKDNEVVVQVRATGMNFPDLLMIQGKYQFEPAFPFAPGAEISGVIKELGAEVSGFKVGDRVISLPGYGGLAEEIAITSDKVVPMPDGMDFITGSCFTMAYGTSYHALKQRADLQAGESLLVLGASGGVGLTAVELGKFMGATVIAAASTDEKLEAAKKAGADHLINYSDGVLKEKVKELTKGKGADVIYDPVGGDLFKQAMRCINWKGRLLVIGFASGDIPAAPANLVLLKGCQIVGVFFGAFAAKEPAANQQNFQELFSYFREGRLNPTISKVLPFEEFLAAFEILAQRKAIGKIVITYAC